MGNTLIIKSERYDDTVLHGGTASLVESLTGDELQYDSISATFETYTELNLITSDGDNFITAENEIFQTADASHIADYVYGTPMYYYHDDILIGKFYLESIKQTGVNLYGIKAISAVGLLSNSYHYGGIYNGTTMAALIEEIIGGVISYTLDPMFRYQPLYGWLPVATRRENLHQVLFAMSASIQKDSTGEMYITALSNETATPIPGNRVFQGGSIDFPTAASVVALSEHAYIARADDEAVTLYDGQISADSITTPSGEIVTGGLVLFDSPAHDLTATGTTIIESTVNYAVLAPSAECMLTGKKYTHTVRQVMRPEAAEDSTETENKVAVTDATLVSVANSENIADRLIDYYGTAKTCNMDIVVGDERPGSAVTFTDPFGDADEGLISSMDISISGVLRANANIITDYSPPNPGNFYNHVAVISQDSTWTIPEGVERIRMVLIGGGQGGEGGHTGATAEGGGASSTLTDGGAGGIAGQGGHGGKIYIATVDVSAGDTYSISIGDGGVGGAAGTVGSVGTATTMGTYTSDSGSVSSIGFTEIFDGNIYGTSGDIGIAGGAGRKQSESPGQTIIYNGVTYTPGADGTYAERDNSSGTQHYQYYPGGGGGCAVAVNGGAGDNRANGGAGASATIPGTDATIYGNGGNGGHGGGGGGGCGIEKATGDGQGMSWTWQGAGGSGGAGSGGGDGAQGCVIIYY